MLSTALRYAAAGIAVMPLHTPYPGSMCSCRAGAACGSPGKHPRLRHGLREASTDPALIRAWWRRWPDANIGLVTGTVLDVCDVDTTPGLSAVLDVLGVIRPAGPLVRTGHGWHLWFAASDLPSRVGMLAGVDWRGHGGSVVAPPSRHATGLRYLFQQPWTTGSALPSCPDPLRRLVLPPPVRVRTSPAASIDNLDRYAQAALHGELQRIRGAPRPVIRHGKRLSGGGRNNAVHLAAFRLGQLAARGGIDRAAVWARLIEAAIDVGLSTGEARRTIASGWRAGLCRPRR
nr:bifunctional DNA primase/polymerase [Catenuloplanes nepalensis]